MRGFTSAAITIRVEVAELGPAAPPLAQINPGENEVAAANQGGQMQPADGTVGQQNGAPDGSQMPSAASGVVGSQLRAGDVGRRQASFTLDAASIKSGGVCWEYGHLPRHPCTGSVFHRDACV